MSYGTPFWESDHTHHFVTTPKRVKALCHDCSYAIVFVIRMVFGFGNSLARAALGLVGMVIPEPVLVRNYTGNPRVHFKENFTVVARKTEAGNHE